MDFDKILDDDQLIKNPVKLIGADYKDGQLILELNQDVNSKWINAFQSIGNYSCILGYAPVNYRFNGNEAMIPTYEGNNNKQIVNDFKDYIAKANDGYKAMISNEINKLKAEEERKIQEKKREEEAREKILGDIEI